jgi:Protein of unknown function (DUF2934)
MNRQASDIFHAQVEKLAYQFWEQRGRPLGSSEEDWFRAEQELRHHFGLSFSFPLDSPMALPFSSFMMGPITQ